MVELWEKVLGCREREVFEMKGRMQEKHECTAGEVEDFFEWVSVVRNNRA